MQGVAGRLRGAPIRIALAVSLLLLAGRAEPEETPSPYATLMERTFKIVNKKVDDVYLLVSGHLSEEGTLSVSPARSTLTVKDTPARVETVSRLIANFDLPPDRVAFDILLVKGVRDSGAGAAPAKAPGGEAEITGETGSPPAAVPSGLKVTNYQRFEKLGSFKVDGLEGRNVIAGEGPESDFRLDIHVGHVDKSRGIIVLERFEVRQKPVRGEPAGGAGAKLEFSDILMNNRPSVFGSARSAASTKALFVIIQARIL